MEFSGRVDPGPKTGDLGHPRGMHCARKEKCTPDGLRPARMDPMRISRIAALVLVLGLGTARVAPSAIAQSTPPKHVEIPEEQRVDINHASLDELLKVRGITKSWAGRIVRFRPYRTKQDLLDKGVVSGEVYNRIKDYIIAHRKDSN